MVNWSRGALVYVHSAISETYLVQWYLHSSICETYLVQWYSIDLRSIGGGIHLHWVYMHSSICEIYLVQWYSIDLWSIGGGRYICPWYMCILLYLTLISCSTIPQILCSIGGGRYIFPRYMCILLYVKLICCSGIPSDLWLIGRGYIWPRYMYILLYVKLTFGVVVFHRSMVNWRKGYICPGYICILAISETYFVQWHSIDLWSIGGGLHLTWVYVHSSTSEIVFGVVVFHRSMVNWRRGAFIYLHSAICETYLVQWHYIDLWSIGGGDHGISAFCYM